MINAIMPWRLLFLAAASVVVTASLPQPTGGVVVPSTCVQLSGNEEVVGVTSLNDILAVASKDKATIHHLYGIMQQCRKVDEIKFPGQVDKLTEFKLLNETSLIFCDSTGCGYCRLGRDPACRQLQIQTDRKDVEISTAAATQSEDGRRIFVRVVFTSQRSLLFAFEEPLLEDDVIHPLSTSLDPSYMQRPAVATAFSVGGFSYFISSALQPNEPRATYRSETDEKEYPARFRVKVSRICDGDATDQLESRIEISLACPGIGDANNNGVTAATYLPENRTIVVAFNTDASDDVVCSYSLDEVNKQVNITWDVCQETRMTVPAICKATPDVWDEACFIFTRMGDHKRSLGCARYALNFDIPPFDMCRLNEYTSSAYRFGNLESYISINGTPIARIDNRGHKFNRVYVDELHSALFFTGDDRMTRVPAKYDGNMSNNKKRTANTLMKYYKPSSRFAMTRVTSGSFMIIDHNRVEEHEISCPSLFTTCDDLQKRGGFADPLNCVFCAMPDSDTGGYVMDNKEKNSCKYPLFEKCPPMINGAYQGRKEEEWIVTGNYLQNLKYPHVLVCEQHCTVNISTAGDQTIYCKLAPTGVRDRNCKVKYVGQLENYQAFTVSPVPPTSDAATQTNPQTSNLDENNSHMSSRTWKIIIAVVAIILILAIIIIIILGARKYLGMRNQKGNGSIGVPFETINSYPRNAARNTYLSTDPSGMPFAASMSPANAPAYERLFREIDSRLKIPSDHLLLEKQIGKGHFGVVLKGTYSPEEGPTKAVACKTLTAHVAGGISEFVNEGLMMDRFDHPRVMTLVGISFNEDRMPIIVTDYMENGDLAKYLRDVKNKPTLRDLLNFTHEIAQGMQYLHENKFIHRDLAARNCMLDRNLHVKIADFGLCRETSATSLDEYLPIHSGREMPLRWMAPEALEKEQFTMAGDVWAFGVVIWEVMTRGMNPYPNLQAYVLFEFLKAGKRMGKPDFCPDILFRVMLDCWHGEPTLRPTFRELPDQIEEIIDVLSNNSRVQMNAEYEQCNSVRNSRAASSSATTPITHHAISHVHSLPLEPSPDPAPV